MGHLIRAKQCRLSESWDQFFFPIEKKGGGSGGGHDFDNDNDDEVEKSFALLGGRRMLWRVEMK